VNKRFSLSHGRQRNVPITLPKARYLANPCNAEISAVLQDRCFFVLLCWAAKPEKWEVWRGVLGSGDATWRAVLTMTCPISRPPRLGVTVDDGGLMGHGSLVNLVKRAMTSSRRCLCPRIPCRQWISSIQPPHLPEISGHPLRYSGSILHRYMPTLCRAGMGKKQKDHTTISSD
jgi:hypothetical protein